MFACPEIGISPFWKGVMWASKAARMGYQWKVGNGKKVKFWEDHWFGHCSLSILFWDLYVLINEQNKSIAELWDGVNLKCTFRRSVDQNLMQRWYDLRSIAESLHLSVEEDAVIWKFDSKGVYSVSSLYAIVNFRGIMPVHIPAVWRIKVQPRVHVFLWLLVNNKLLSRDNLSKRQHVPDVSCVFCSEVESVTHLFFECVVASEMWNQISMLTGIKLQVNLFSVSSLWICEKTNQVPNIVHAAALWSLWKLRNDLCFNGSGWSCMQVLYLKVAHTLERWKVLCPDGKRSELERVCAALMSLVRQAPPLIWPEPG
jgi:hypothetical protein